MGHWIHALQPLLNLVLTPSCALCQRSATDVLCRDCGRQVQRCQMAGNVGWQSGALPYLGWGDYGGALKRAIAMLKYENHPQLARPLGDWLAQAWLAAPALRPPSERAMPLTVVPIPLHRSKQRQRGYNQAAILAQQFCRQTGLPLRQQGLERSRETEAQFGLSANQREQNLQDVFQLGKDFRQRPPRGAILLLDDIYTTGATARAAAYALRQQQIQVYGLVAVAVASLDRRPNQPTPKRL